MTAVRDHVRSNTSFDCNCEHRTKDGSYEQVGSIAAEPVSSLDKLTLVVKEFYEGVLFPCIWNIGASSWRLNDAGALYPSSTRNKLNELHLFPKKGLLLVSI
jgi:hypothetical protein